MYCTCSNKNNYDIITNCDIKKFSEKNGPFDNSAWTQISVTDVLSLECTNPPIESVEKIYINTDIVSTKLIETPITNNVNSEGMILTGKKLLIDGYICSKIIYTSLTPEQYIHTASFNIPFCTYIVIDGNTDIYADIYCVKDCIEDVFLSLVDCKSIFQNVTLFLLAIKVTPTCPTPPIAKNDCTIIPPVLLPNTITIKSNTNETVATIQFNATNQSFIVSSTGQTADSTQGAQEYFVLTLRKISNNFVVLREHIDANMNATDFSNVLNNKNFSFSDDYLELSYLIPNRITISNFPSSPTTHTPTLPKEFYKVTNAGLVKFTPSSPILQVTLPGTPSNLLPFINSIIINNIHGQNLATISFDNVNNVILTKGSNEISEISDCTFNYFSFKLIASYTYEIKTLAFISTNGDSRFFVKSLNNTPFNLSDIIELECSYPENVVITNYPIVGTNYNLVTALECYTINSQTLQAYTLPENIPSPDTSNPANSLSTIILENEDYEEVLKIELIKGKFKCTCTGEIANKNIGNIEYFSFTLEDSTGIIKFYEKISAIEIGDTFCNNLNNLSYNQSDIITLSYEDNSKVLITEIDPSMSYSPLDNTESFAITNNKLIPI